MRFALLSGSIADFAAPLYLFAQHFRPLIGKVHFAFFDGHCATYDTADLPGGIGVAKTSDFNYNNLKANFPPPRCPMGR